MKKTLFSVETTTKPLKKCFKDDGNENFIVIKYKEFQFD